MLEAEKKHAIAELLRGVSPMWITPLDAVSAGAQIEADIPSNGLQPETLSADVRQIEQSIEICRGRIFGRDAGSGL